MARLIDADALSLPMIGDGDMQGRYTATMGYRGQGRVLAVVHEVYRRAIAEAPTVDAVEVVRCKDCKFLHDKGYCTLVTGMTRIKHDDYCSRGERRNDG